MLPRLILSLSGRIFDRRTNGVADRVCRGLVEAAHHQVRLRQGWIDCRFLQRFEDSDLLKDVGGHGVQ
jgi:hypothetical protein